MREDGVWRCVGGPFTGDGDGDGAIGSTENATDFFGVPPADSDSAGESSEETERKIAEFAERRRSPPDGKFGI